MPGSLTTPDWMALAISLHPMLPSALSSASASGLKYLFAARWLAYALRCQRFGDALAGEAA